MEDCDNKICRLCASECSDKCINLEQVDIRVIYEIIKKHFSIDIAPKNPSTTVSICNECYSFINKLKNFAKMVEETQNFFEKYEDQFNDLIETIAIEFVPIAETNFQESPENSKQLIVRDKSISEEIEIKIPEKLDAEVCSSSTKPKQLNRHKNDSSLIKTSYICEVCAETCKTATQLKKHLQTIHNLSDSSILFSCAKCEKSFSTERGYRTHAKKHILKNMTCKLCGAGFNKKISFKNHVKLVHSNNRPFICEQCGKGFKRSGDLNRHKEFHRVDTPFQCSICEKSFNCKMVLKIHEKIHSDIKYECTVCGLKLKTQHTLKCHMRIHSNDMEFQCNFCNKLFKHKKNLTCHLVTHTGLQPYSCIFCNQAFSLSWNCRTHQKNVHPKEYNQFTETGRSTIVTAVVKQRFACGPKQRIDKYSINNLKEYAECNTEVFLSKDV